MSPRGSPALLFLRDSGGDLLGATNIMGENRPVWEAEMADEGELFDWGRLKPLEGVTKDTGV